MAWAAAMKVLVWTANLLGWPIVHFAIGGTVLRLPSVLFSRDSWLTRERPWERGGSFYREVFAVQRWKSRLPDGAPWMGGMPKKRLTSRNTSYLQLFIEETRRGEVAHWCMILCTPVFFLWNPLWACVVMACYGIAANVPCILVQRANRIQLTRVLTRNGRRVYPGV